VFDGLYCNFCNPFECQITTHRCVPTTSVTCVIFSPTSRVSLLSRIDLWISEWRVSQEAPKDPRGPSKRPGGEVCVAVSFPKKSGPHTERVPSYPLDANARLAASGSRGRFCRRVSL
jgi:hypothetical protein